MPDLPFVAMGSVVAQAALER